MQGGFSKHGLLPLLEILDVRSCRMDEDWKSCFSLPGWVKRRVWRSSHGCVWAASKEDEAQPGPTLCTSFAGAMGENPESSSRQVGWNSCRLQLWEACQKAIGLIGSPFLTLSNLFCCCSVATSCPTLCDSMNCSTPGSSVLHCLPELAQIHVHWVGDAI